MSMLGIDGVANLRWARHEPSSQNLRSYVLLMFLCCALTLSLYLLLFESDYLSCLIILSGFMMNFKALGLCYLRNISGNNASSFMIKDSLIFLLGAFGLFLVDTEIELIILLSVTLSGGIVFLMPALKRAMCLNSTIFRIRTMTHLYLILKNSVYMFASAFFVTYIPIIARSAVEFTQTEQYFVAFSVALSIAINLQKVSLAYFWVLQKRYWSKVSQGIFRDENIYRLGLLILVTCVGVFITQQLFDYFNAKIDFQLNVLAITVMITFHRMLVSWYRLHLLTVTSAWSILANQIKLIAILLIASIAFYLLSDISLILLYAAVFLSADIIFVYHLPLLRRTKIAF